MSFKGLRGITLFLNLAQSSAFFNFQFSLHNNPLARSQNNPRLRQSAPLYLPDLCLRMQVCSPTLTADLCLIPELRLLRLGFSAPSSQPPSICRQEQSPSARTQPSLPTVLPEMAPGFQGQQESSTLGATLWEQQIFSVTCDWPPVWKPRTFPAWALHSSSASCQCRAALCGWGSY